MRFVSFFRRWSKSQRSFNGFGPAFESRHAGINKQYLDTRCMMTDGLKEDFIKRDGSFYKKTAPAVAPFIGNLNTQSMLCGMNGQEGDACRLSVLFGILTDNNSSFLQTTTRADVAKNLKKTRAKRASAERYLQTASTLLQANNAARPSVS